MTQKDNILHELNELKSSLATINAQNVYTVPVGYFDGLAAQVLNRIKAMEATNVTEELGYLSPMLSNLSKQMPYSVPVGYFEGFEANLLQSVRESNDYQTAKEELETLSPLLNGLKKEMPYSVPQGYFEQLASTITKGENKPVIKVVSITSRTWFRYAAAALVIGLVTITGFLLIGKGEKEPGGKALAKLTRDIKKMDETQKDNLIDFIDAGMSGQESAQVTSPNNKSEVKDLLKGISDEELKDFQEQTEDVQDVLTTN